MFTLEEPRVNQLALDNEILMSCKLNVQIENIRIQNVTDQKLLGIYIDEQQTWSSHIYHLCSVLVSKIPLLRQLPKYV